MTNIGSYQNFISIIIILILLIITFIQILRFMKLKIIYSLILMDMKEFLNLKQH